MNEKTGHIEELLDQIRSSLHTIEDAADEEILNIIEKWHSVSHELKKICVRNAKHTFENFENKWVAQTLQFAIDCVPELHRILLRHYKRADHLSLLDVGAGSGVGANLIASLHADRMIYSKIDVDAIDYIDKRLLWAKMQYPKVNYTVEDLYNLKDRKWDFIFCSHCLEHVPSPREFCQKMVELCKGFVFVYTPYNEIELMTDHINTITEEFYGDFNVDRIQIFKSMAWRADRPEDKVILATLDCRE